MPEENINEDFLLLLIEKDGFIDTTVISIDNHFENETLVLKKLCQGGDDNIFEIIEYIENYLKPKLPCKTFNYCKELDKPFQSVIVNVEVEVKEIIEKREKIFFKKELAEKFKTEFSLEENFRDFKNAMVEKIELWFKAFNIDFAYEKAKKIPNILTYSHRISGWSNPQRRITNNLKLQLKTNFGYGSASYFYSLLIFKDIQITPLSEWIDYQYSKFSQVIRYTKSFRSRIPITDKENNFRYYLTKIENSFWYNAIEFTKFAANLSLTNEDDFIERYIINECEKMIKGLEVFYKETEFDFINEIDIKVQTEEVVRHRVDINGYELIDFRTEKIVGALDFINKINEYNKIIPTNAYIKRIMQINKDFIPNVYKALDKQNQELKTSQDDYRIFISKHDMILEKEKFYKSEKLKSKIYFDANFKEEFNGFSELLIKSLEELNYHNHKIKSHEENVKKLTEYINKFKSIVTE